MTPTPTVRLGRTLRTLSGADPYEYLFTLSSDADDAGESDLARAAWALAEQVTRTLAGLERLDPTVRSESVQTAAQR